MIAVADATNLPLADQSVDLVVGSPPYCDCRDYGIDATRNCAPWVEWVLKVTTECLRVCRGAVVWVVWCPTRGRSYWPAAEGLAWLWWMRGGSMYRPCFWYAPARIPGSGGDQWFRADVEYVLCFKRPGKLPWTDNTAMGHPPKWAPGGEMSHRLSSGARVNQWGRPGSRKGPRKADGTREKTFRPSHRQATKARADGEPEAQEYAPPAIANPGNLIRTNVGGGHMGHPLATENEAPYPEQLPEWFILSLCRPGGTVLDPFSGSGTTAAVAERHGRRYIATDIRESQCGLTRRRLAGNQLELSL